MALKIEITRDSGITSTYHKIKSIDINEIEKKSVITVEEYLNETFRESAKEAEDLITKIKEVKDRLEKTKEETIANALIEKVNLLSNKKDTISNTKYFVKETSIALDYIPEDTSIRGFYNELKNIDIYKNAEEV